RDHHECDGMAARPASHSAPHMTLTGRDGRGGLSSVDLSPRLPRSRRPRLAWLWRTLAPLFGGYLAICLIARLGYRVLLYPAPPHDPPFQPSGDQKLLSLRAEDGALVVAAELPPPDDRARTIVLFHGNGETIGNRLPLAESLRAHGL